MQVSCQVLCAVSTVNQILPRFKVAIKPFEAIINHARADGLPQIFQRGAPFGVSLAMELDIMQGWLKANVSDEWALVVFLDVGWLPRGANEHGIRLGSCLSVVDYQSDDVRVETPHRVVGHVRVRVDVAGVEGPRANTVDLSAKDAVALDPAHMRPGA